MNINNLTITHHAKDRFMDRLTKSHHDMVKNPERLFLKLLKQSYPINGINPGSLLNRLNRHDNIPVLYFRTKCGWRFVISEDEEGNRTLLTVERMARYQN